MKLLGLHRFGQEDLNPGEEIIYRAGLFFLAFLRRSILGFTVFALGILIVVLSFVYRDVIGFLTDPSITMGVVVFAGLPFFIGLYLLTRNLLDYFYDEDIITNQRVIDYNQKFFFSKEQSTAHLKTIENINLIQNGVFRSLFNYGSLQVQTAASGSFTQPNQSPRFLFLDDVRKPKNIQRLIDELSHRVKADQSFQKEELLRVCGLK